MKHPALILACLLVVSCAHVAKHYDTPDHAKLDDASKRLGIAVAQLKTASAKVTADMATVRQSHAREAELTRAFDKPLADLAKVAPAELLPAITEMQQRMAALEQSQQGTEAKLAELTTAQADVDAIAARADAATKDMEKYTPLFQQDVDSIVKKLNDAEMAWAKDSKEIVSLRTGSIIAKILTAVAVLVIGALVVLYFLGKVSLTGLRAVAR